MLVSDLENIFFELVYLFVIESLRSRGSKVSSPFGPSTLATLTDFFSFKS